MADTDSKRKSAGRVLLLPKGDWTAGTAYKSMDFVYSDGCTYVCTSDVAGSTAPAADAAHWQLMSGGIDNTEFNEVKNDVEALGNTSLLNYSIVATFG